MLYPYDEERTLIKYTYIPVKHNYSSYKCINIKFIKLYQNSEPTYLCWPQYFEVQIISSSLPHHLEGEKIGNNLALCEPFYNNLNYIHR